MTCEVREKVFLASNCEIRIAITAYRNGNGKVILVASTIHRRLTMDFVTTTEKIGRLWMEDQGRLTELAFALECSNCLNEIDTKDTHKDFFELFQSLPVTVVAAFQGHREWHIARRFSLTPTTTHALIKALLRHYSDLQHDFVRVVCEFMCHTYDYDKRAEEVERREAEAEDAEEEQTTYTDAELLENGVPEVAEECETVPLTARYDMVLFGAGKLSSDEMKARINQGTEEYLTAFLTRANMSPEKIPKSAGPMRTRCIKWMSEDSADRRPYILLTMGELKDK